MVSEIGIVSIGMLLVVLIGGIDLSVGAVLALSAVVLGLTTQLGCPPFLAVALAIASGVAAGGLNGLVVGRAGIPSIIVTLGTMAAYRGVALGLSGGNSFPLPEALQMLGQSELLGLPQQFALFVALALACRFLLQRTVAGLTLFALGNNETAARFAGLRVELGKTAVYAACGGLAALAGVVFAARVSSAKADFGVGVELDAITVVVLSGASLAGGSANVPGLVLGLLIVGSLRMGLTMVFVPAETQAILVGLVLIGAVASRRLGGLLRGALRWRPVGGERGA
jgi:rhamnose transport system permease protein